MNAEKRNICASLMLLFLFILGYSSKVSAVEYQNGIKVNDELIWNCHVCDVNKMDALFGDFWDAVGIFENLSSNTRMKWRINTIEENSTSLSSIVSVWNWRLEDNWGMQDTNSKFSFLKNPHLYPNDFNFTGVFPYISLWLPIPVGEYLGELPLGEIYDVDNRVLPTLNVQIMKYSLLPSVPAELVYYIVIYNNNGIMSSFKLYTSGNIVVIDISLENLAIFVIPSTIGLILAFACSIVLFVKKKRNN